ncbi:MAG: metallophosphoesterase [Acidobacteria bacterium]|nr:metallophosphoesterase [Acidobacteriota bacterium]
MARTVTWLHLSDLHVGSKNFDLDSQDVLETLLNDLRKLQQSNGLIPDLIFFTGDIAFGQIDNQKGKTLTDQYVFAQRLIDKIRYIFIPEVQLSNVFLVPGNHDVNRYKTTAATNMYLSQAKINDIQSHIDKSDNDWKGFMQRLEDYEQFLEANKYDHLLQDRSRLIYTTIREISGVRIGIAGFNSVWSSCGDGEKGKLWLAGDWMCNNLWRKLQDAHISIALIHHPINWFRPEEDNRLLLNKLERKFNFLLHGHEHQGWVNETKENHHVRIGAYASYESSDKEAGYNYVRLNLDTGEGEVWLRTYDRLGGEWIPREIGGHTHYGVWHLNLDWIKQIDYNRDGFSQMDSQPSQIPSHLNIFISGTYRELYDYRDVLEKKLQHLASYLKIKINFYPKVLNDQNITLTKEKDVEKFDIYIGLIGQLYGEEGAEELSETEIEYERVSSLYERGKPAFLIYFADEDNIRLPHKFIERDEKKSVKQNKFRRKLEAQHTIKKFTSPQDLALKVVSDIHRLMDEGHFVNYRVFDVNNMHAVCDAIDDSKRNHRIEEFIFSTAEYFRDLFKLNPQQLYEHPFLRDLGSKLMEMMPGISTTDRNGVLTRSNIRHVILRQESFLAILRKVQETQLYDLGQEIGRGAAEDVIVNVLERRKFIPGSPEAFVYLWDYWDKTGGWGTLKATGDPKNFTDPPKPKPAGEPWRITIENNCLATPNTEETHKLYNLWRGYIYGFLDQALPRLSKLINKLPDNEKSKVAIPAFTSVKSVVVSSSNSDNVEFLISFESVPYSASREDLRRAKLFINKQQNESASLCLKYALEHALKENKTNFNALLKNYKDSALISVILSKSLPETVSDKDINLWFELVNLFIDELSQIKRHSNEPNNSSID